MRKFFLSLFLILFAVVFFSVGVTGPAWGYDGLKFPGEVLAIQSSPANAEMAIMYQALHPATLISLYMTMHPISRSLRPQPMPAKSSPVVSKPTIVLKCI